MRRVLSVQNPGCSIQRSYVHSETSHRLHPSSNTFLQAVQLHDNGPMLNRTYSVVGFLVAAIEFVADIHNCDDVGSQSTVHKLNKKSSQERNLTSPRSRSHERASGSTGSERQSGFSERTFHDRAPPETQPPEFRLEVLRERVFL